MKTMKNQILVIQFHPVIVTNKLQPRPIHLRLFICFVDCQFVVDFNNRLPWPSASLEAYARRISPGDNPLTLSHHAQPNTRECIMTAATIRIVHSLIHKHNRRIGAAIVLIWTGSVCILISIKIADSIDTQRMDWVRLTRSMPTFAHAIGMLSWNSWVLRSLDELGCDQVIHTIKRIHQADFASRIHAVNWCVWQGLCNFGI